jgi:hypothetical protein
MATGGEGEAWPAFTESSSCGAQRVSTPHAAQTGGLSVDAFIRGPFGAVFGRSVSQILEDLVLWPLPGSTETLAVHPSMIPALDRAGTVIEAALDDGLTYHIRNRTTFSATARTIAGSLRISRHTFGTAIDINADLNPNRSDNQLITNLPDWWVDAFLDAGFCWGGLWIGSKDAMHFAWQGPAFSGATSIPLPYEPLTDVAAFSKPRVSIPVIPQARPGTIASILADADGNGAIDVIRLTDTDDGFVVDVSVASRRHNACSLRRSIVDDLDDLPRRSIAQGFGDWDGKGGQDLWFASDDNGLLRLTVRWAFGGYAAETGVRTAVATPSADAWISTADYDVNGTLDLFVIDGDQFDIWEIDSTTGATRLLASFPNPHPGASTHFLGDVNLDNRPDLWSIHGDNVRIATAASGYLPSPVSAGPLDLPDRVDDAVAADYDGDGRADLITFDGRVKTVWLGNTPLPDGLADEVWFEYEEPGCETGETTWDRQEYRFTSDGWVATGSYEWRSRHDLPVPCDPSEDRCDVGTVTGTSLAEFFAWVDGLGAVPGDDAVAAATAVTRAGYALPCALDDRVCWDEPVLRSDVATYFGQFLANRRGDVPAPHRWVTSQASRQDRG